MHEISLERTHGSRDYELRRLVQVRFRTRPGRCTAILGLLPARPLERCLVPRVRRGLFTPPLELQLCEAQACIECVSDALRQRRPQAQLSTYLAAKA